MSRQPQQQQNRGNPLQDYVTVAERIEKFYEKHPTGRINTTIIEHDAERGFILFRAEVFRNPDDAMPSSTGHAYEYRDGGYVQKTSYIEVCETSAVGRALALLGLEVKRGIASREEMQKQDRMQSAPRLAPAPNQRTEECASNSSAKPDTQTMARIRELRKALEITTPVDFSKLTHSQAESMLADLISKQR